MNENSNEFSRYLQKLRESSRLGLTTVAERTRISKGYLSQLESGKRKSPHPDVLRRLATVYSITTVDLLRKAGYLVDADEQLSEEAKLEGAFRHVLSDPDFEYGTKVAGEASSELKRFIVEMYEKTTGKKLL